MKLYKFQKQRKFVLRKPPIGGYIGEKGCISKWYIFFRNNLGK